MNDERPVTQVDLLRMEEHIIERIRALKELMTEKDQAARQAVSAALAAANKEAERTAHALKEYKESANEWRMTLEGLVNSVPTNKEMDAKFDALDNRITELNLSRERGTGKMEGTEAARRTHQRITALMITVGLSVLGQVIAVVLFFFRQ